MSLGRLIEYKHLRFTPFTPKNPDLLNSMKIDFKITIIAHGDIDHAGIRVTFGNVF